MGYNVLSPDGPAAHGRYGAGELIIDFDFRSVHRAGRRIRLSRTEWRILTALARAPGRVVRRERLLRDVWIGARIDLAARRLRVHLTYLRRKLEPEPASPCVIVTELGFGYRLAVEPLFRADPTNLTPANKSGSSGISGNMEGRAAPRRPVNSATAQERGDAD